MAALERFFDRMFGRRSSNSRKIKKEKTLPPIPAADSDIPSDLGVEALLKIDENQNAATAPLEKEINELYSNFDDDFTFIGANVDKTSAILKKTKTSVYPSLASIKDVQENAKDNKGPIPIIEEEFNWMSGIPFITTPLIWDGELNTVLKSIQNSKLSLLEAEYDFQLEKDVLKKIENNGFQNSNQINKRKDVTSYRRRRNKGNYNKFTKNNTKETESNGTKKRTKSFNDSNHHKRRGDLRREKKDSIADKTENILNEKKSIENSSHGRNTKRWSSNEENGKQKHSDTIKPIGEGFSKNRLCFRCGSDMHLTKSCTKYIDNGLKHLEPGNKSGQKDLSLSRRNNEKTSMDQERLGARKAGNITDVSKQMATGHLHSRQIDLKFLSAKTKQMAQKELKIRSNLIKFVDSELTEKHRPPFDLHLNDCLPLMRGDQINGYIKKYDTISNLPINDNYLHSNSVNEGSEILNNMECKYCHSKHHLISDCRKLEEKKKRDQAKINNSLKCSDTSKVKC